jgi:osmoprotectant transport system ATP-binding protein
MNPLVSFRSVGYRVGAIEVLRDFTLDVAQGETVALLGGSGAGKTSALKLVNALLQPTAGEVLVQGKPVREWNAIRLRRRVGYVIQETGLFPHFTVAENVGLVPRLEGWEESVIAGRVEELLALVGLNPREHGPRYPRQLSGGQRQRVGVARALAADPPLLLLDEPFGSLDPLTRAALQEEFIGLVRRLNKTVLFVTHDVREALVLGSRIALLRAGRLEVLATPEEFLQSRDTEAQAFIRCLDWSGKS